MDWQPVETAPFAQLLLAWVHLPKNPQASGWVIATRCVFRGKPDPNSDLGPCVEGAWWANGRYYAPGDDRGYVTHWMTLPPAPTSSMRDNG